jgi:hypothetical protein
VHCGTMFSGVAKVMRIQVGLGIPWNLGYFSDAPSSETYRACDRPFFIVTFVDLEVLGKVAVTTRV